MILIGTKMGKNYVLFNMGGGAADQSLRTK